MPTSNRNPRLLPSLFLAATVLLPIALATAAPKTATHTSTPKKAAPANSAPASLGNGIFILGDDGAQPLSTPSKSSTTPVPQRRGTASLPAPRTSQVNLNAALVRFCRANLGRKVGNGQCSELAVLGLPAIGARLDFNNQWGEPVCNYGATGGRQYLQLAPAGKTRANPRRASVKPGDIIQYQDVKFERRWDGGYSVREYPHHTSVIEQVSRDGNTLKVLEQNVNNTQFVVETLLYLPDQTEGIMRITRPLAR